MEIYKCAVVMTDVVMKSLILYHPEESFEFITHLLTSKLLELLSMYVVVKVFYRIPTYPS